MTSNARQRAYQREWQAQNPGKMQAYSEKYRAANRDEINARNRERYAANREKFLAKNRTYREANREKTLAYQREYNATNQEEKNSKARERYLANRENELNRGRKYNAIPGKRRAVQMRYHHGMETDEWAALWAAQDGCCYLCECPLDPDGRVNIDHDHSCCPRNRSCRICRRGLTCTACNVAIGMADDQPELLRLIADNLEIALAAVRARMASRPEQLELGA
jgi:hypothetical protein